jgi:hypothetical protein
MGFKIARQNLSIREFGITMAAMLVYYFTIFVLLVFNDIFQVGSFLYNIVNFIFLIICAKYSVQIIVKLKTILAVARNMQNPERAIRAKLRIMKLSTTIIILFFLLEITYHGVLRIFNFPHTFTQDNIFFLVHESTDCAIILLLLYIMRAKDYIPYYGVINVDSNIIEEDDEIEFQRLQNVKMYEFWVNPSQLKSQETNYEIATPLLKGDLAIIVNPTDK